jgi:hypothetical protein
MSNETIREFIERREKELQHQLAALDAQVLARKAELDELALIKTKLREAEFERQEKEIFAYGTAPQLPAAVNATTSNFTTATTIKEMVIQALLDHFPDGGTTIEIRDFIQDAYGRDIMPSSLRPQMHRLKADGVLGQDPAADTWNFRDGKRRVYARYSHSSARKAMKELQDEAPSENQSDGAPKVADGKSEPFKRRI